MYNKLNTSVRPTLSHLANKLTDLPRASSTKTQLDKAQKSQIGVNILNHTESNFETNTSTLHSPKKYPLQSGSKCYRDSTSVEIKPAASVKQSSIGTKLAVNTGLQQANRRIKDNNKSDNTHRNTDDIFKKVKKWDCNTADLVYKQSLNPLEDIAQSEPLTSNAISSDSTATTASCENNTIQSDDIMLIKDTVRQPRDNIPAVSNFTPSSSFRSVNSSSTTSYTPWTVTDSGAKSHLSSIKEPAAVFSTSRTKATRKLPFSSAALIPATKFSLTLAPSVTSSSESLDTSASSLSALGQLAVSPRKRTGPLNASKPTYCSASFIKRRCTQGIGSDSPQLGSAGIRNIASNSNSETNSEMVVRSRKPAQSRDEVKKGKNDYWTGSSAQYYGSSRNQSIIINETKTEAGNHGKKLPHSVQDILTAMYKISGKGANAETVGKGKQPVRINKSFDNFNSVSRSASNNRISKAKKTATNIATWSTDRLNSFLKDSIGDLKGKNKKTPKIGHNSSDSSRAVFTDSDRSPLSKQKYLEEFKRSFLNRFQTADKGRTGCSSSTGKGKQSATNPKRFQSTLMNEMSQFFDNYELRFCRRDSQVGLGFMLL